MNYNASVRAQVIARRTYSRPTNEAGTTFETWAETTDRVILHQRWLWERALGDRPLNSDQLAELAELRSLIYNRKATVSGRTLWLGGTDVARKRESSQFNCAFLQVANVHDVVDAFWLLLQGCGVGFEPITGTLNGFTQPAKVEVVRSQRHLLVSQRGRETNKETIIDGVWRLEIGDSAEAWAKAVGKVMAQKAGFHTVILDFSQIRPAGSRLRGYGWISSGDEKFCESLVQICAIMNRRAGQLLDRIDILDICNWLGTTLSSRRSAEIALVPYGDPQWREFALAKRDHFELNPQRAQSNNSLLFNTRPSRHDLRDIFQMVINSGGSEPGFINAEQALFRAPWFKGVNPCAEILLANKGFCNLVEIALPKFNNDAEGLYRAMWLISRANYRQTCVNLIDGVLQTTWHETNEFLRLCGVGVTGVVGWSSGNDPLAWQELRKLARAGANSMADELGLPRPKAVTTIKPSGTLSKVMDVPEGIHKPLGKFIFNNVRFSKHDPIVETLTRAGYFTFEDPYSSDATLVRLPASWDTVSFHKDVRGLEINRESALDQLNRYKLVMDNYVDFNASITVSYDPHEADSITNWIHRNWDTYIGVSFLPRMDPTKTPEDLGYPYLPQQVVTEETFREYVSKLLPVDIESRSIGHDDVDESQMLVDAGEECAGGVCPVK